MHVKITADDNKSWCGEDISAASAFKDAEAAALNGLFHMTNFIQPCINCVEKIIACLNKKVTDNDNNNDNKKTESTQNSSGN